MSEDQALPLVSGAAQGTHRKVSVPLYFRDRGLLDLIRAGDLRPVHDAATSNYRPDIDGLRAVAVLAVLLYHGGLETFSGGFVGVDIFFVISGFLIGRIVLSQIEAGRFSLMSFYDRRVRRIVPPLLAMFAGTLAMGYVLLLPAQLKGLGYEILTANAFVSNIWFWLQTGYFTPDAHLQPLLHSWSLSIEEQFYLFFPAMILAAFVLSRRLVLPAIASVLLVSFVLGAVLTPSYPSATFFLLPTRAWELLTGVVLAMPLLKSPGSRARATMAATIGLLAMLGPIFLFTEVTPFPGTLAAFPVVGAALMIWAGGTGNIVSKALSARPMVFVGLLSYSLYLWHWPIYVAARHLVASADLTSWQVLACMALAMGAAILSVRYVEAPFRDRKAMPARRAYPMLSAGIALVCAAGIAAILSDGAPQRFRPATLQLAAGAANFSTLGKECRNTDFSTVMERCRIGAEVAPSFVLWGDSHAAALSPALALVAAKANRSGLIIASDGCLPAIDFAQSELTKVDRARCLAQARAFTRFLAEHPELDTVIVTARWYKRENPDPVIMAAMERTIDWLRANDRAIVLIAGLPVPDSDVPWRLAASDAVGRVVPPFVHRRDEGPFYAMLESAGSKSRLRYIPLAPALCDGERCLAEFEGRSLFADDDHLTVFAAERLVAPYLDRVGLFAARAPSSSR